MSIVKFPGLGLEWNVSRVAFKIGGIIIYRYAICIVLRDNGWINLSKM